MNELTAGLLAAPVVLLLAVGLIPSRRANAAAQPLGRLTMLLTGLMLLGSLAAAVRVVTGGPIDAAFLRSGSPVPFCLGVYVDALAVVMMVLMVRDCSAAGRKPETGPSLNW